MNFGDLRRRLVDELRWRVYNGEITERGLARSVGVSQPHIHKVLKGGKILSLKFCDRILTALGWSICDLADDAVLERWLRQRRAGASESVALDVLEGRLGPGEPWPVRISGRASFALRPADIAAFSHPVAAQVAADPRMHGCFTPDDWVLLDQSTGMRCNPVQDGLYLLQWNGRPLIRFVQPERDRLCIISHDVRDDRLAWDWISVPSLELPRLIRARVHFIVPAQQWTMPDPVSMPPLRRPPRDRRRAPAPRSVAS